MSRSALSSLAVMMFVLEACAPQPMRVPITRAEFVPLTYEPGVSPEFAPLDDKSSDLFFAPLPRPLE